MASYTRPSSKYGPTATTTATKRFEQRLRGVLSRINAAIKTAIRENDILQLKNRASSLDVSPPDEEPFQFRTDDGRVIQFIQWLRNQLQNELLQIVSTGENPYIRRVYTTGIRSATKQLDEVDWRTVDVSEIVDEGRFDSGLQEIFSRTYENLQSVTNDIVEDVREELATGYQEGWSPSKTARNLTDRVDSIGKNRATLIARTETSNAHTAGFADRVEQAQDEFDTDVGIRHVGRLTANDADVCPFCRGISDVTFTIEEFTNLGAQWGSQTMRLGIPSHPNCRCAPVAEVDMGGLEPLEERLPTTIRGKPVAVIGR